MIKVEIVKKGYGHAPGMVLELNEFDAGHLMAFGYAVPYVSKREMAVLEPPETREEQQEHKAKPFFGRGRRPKKR